jgi:putative membrane protein
VKVSDLPAVNASLNALAAMLLVAGFIFIRRGNKAAHAKCMVSAFVVSTIFLITYVTHKALVHGAHTKIGAEGFVRGFYYVIQITHIVLAAAIVPMALITMTRALRKRFDRHRAIARWTWPIWMYVSVTGVLIYFMLYHWFPAAPL